MIRCANLSLTFQNRVLFKDLNFEVSKGEHACLSGESGKGKSTMLRILLGFVLPDNGDIWINEQKLSQKTISNIRKKMVWIPQNVNLMVQNGDELIRLMNMLDREMQIHELLEKLGLEGSILDEDFTKISGGEKQRTIVAVLLSLNKPIILMDEPTSSLDELSIKRLISVLKDMKNTTIISTSHNQVWMSQADKVIQL